MENVSTCGECEKETRHRRWVLIKHKRQASAPKHALPKGGTHWLQVFFSYVIMMNWLR